MLQDSCINFLVELVPSLVTGVGVIVAGGGAGGQYVRKQSQKKKRKRRGMKSGEIEQETLPEERNPETELQQESEESDIDCFSGEDDETTTEEGEDGDDEDEEGEAKEAEAPKSSKT